MNSLARAAVKPPGEGDSETLLVLVGLNLPCQAN